MLRFVAAELNYYNNFIILFCQGGVLEGPQVHPVSQCLRLVPRQWSWSNYKEHAGRHSRERHNHSYWGLGILHLLRSDIFLTMIGMWRLLILKLILKAPDFSGSRTPRWWWRLSIQLILELWWAGSSSPSSWCSCWGTSTWGSSRRSPSQSSAESFEPI